MLRLCFIAYKYVEYISDMLRKCKTSHSYAGTRGFAVAGSNSLNSPFEPAAIPDKARHIFIPDRNDRTDVRDETLTIYGHMRSLTP
jgi:hypothetical protein